MDIHALSTILAIAATGYGEIVDGQPTWAQRELHVYTNFARVAPEEWESDYDCNLTEFTSEERLGKAPLYYHDGLTSIAQAHSDDMFDNEFMSHDSSDGTDFGTRVWPWYDGMMIAENVAWGYADNWDVVFDGWMCSAGHRQNIMSGDLEHMGTGVQGRAYTQDFGAGAHLTDIQVAMGVHYPEEPVREVEFFATWEDDDGPDGLWVETTSDCIQMDIVAGTEERGAWHLEAESEDGCAAYRFVWETSSGIGGVLPEDGAYQYGAGCAPWVSETPAGCSAVDDEPGTEDDDDSSPDSDGSSDNPDDGNPSDEGPDDGTEMDDDSDHPDESGEDQDESEEEEEGAVRRSQLCADSSQKDCFGDEDSEPKGGCSTVPTNTPKSALVLLLCAVGLVQRRRE